LEKLLTGENAVQVGKTWAAIFFSHTFAQKLPHGFDFSNEKSKKTAAFFKAAVAKRVRNDG